MNIKNELIQLTTDVKTGAAVAVTTVGTGASTSYFDLIPSDIGKLASLTGIVLTVILSYTHLLTVKKTNLEIKALKEKEKFYTKQNKENEKKDE